MSRNEYGKPVEQAAGGRGGPLRVAVLVSGSGSNLQALIDAIEGRELPDVEIVLVISNKADAYGLQRALKHRLPALFLPWTKPAQQQEAEARILALLRLFGADLIVLAGWMRIFSPEFIAQLPQRMINLHPALLPDDSAADSYTTSDGSSIPALRGLHVVQRALDAGLPVTGSTVHYVIPKVDAGPVIARAEVTIQPQDSAETLHERLKQVEHTLVVEAVRMVSARPAAVCQALS